MRPGSTGPGASVRWPPQRPSASVCAGRRARPSHCCVPRCPWTQPCSAGSAALAWPKRTADSAWR
eukprot:10230313-Alexandrium_andersonii.AAC.1